MPVLVVAPRAATGGSVKDAIVACRASSHSNVHSFAHGNENVCGGGGDCAPPAANGGQLATAGLTALAGDAAPLADGLLLDDVGATVAARLRYSPVKLPSLKLRLN